MASNWTTGAIGGALAMLMLLALMRYNPSLVETFVSIPLTKRITRELELPATPTRCAKTVHLTNDCFQPTQAELCATHAACVHAVEEPVVSAEPNCSADGCCRRPPKPRLRQKRRHRVRIVPKRVTFSEPLETEHAPAIDDMSFNAIEDMFGFKSGASIQTDVDPVQEKQLPRSIKRRAPVIDLNDSVVPKCLQQAACEQPTLPIADMRSASCVENQLDCADRMHYDEALALGREPVVHERVVLAPVRSRLREQGDAWRGDLPIAPVAPTVSDTCSLVMFRPSVAASLDLRQGYFTPTSTSTSCALNRLVASA